MSNKILAAFLFEQYYMLSRHRGAIKLPALAGRTTLADMRLRERNLFN